MNFTTFYRPQIFIELTNNMFMYTKQITVIDLENGFYIDIETNEEYETKDFFIYHIDYATKMFMFGLGTEYKDFIEIAKKNKDNYIKIYKEKYMD